MREKFNPNVIPPEMLKDAHILTPDATLNHQPFTATDAVGGGQLLLPNKMFDSKAGGDRTPTRQAFQSMDPVNGELRVPQPIEKTHADAAAEAEQLKHDEIRAKKQRQYADMQHPQNILDLKAGYDQRMANKKAEHDALSSTSLGTLTFMSTKDQAPKFSGYTTTDKRGGGPKTSTYHGEIEPDKAEMIDAYVQVGADPEHPRNVPDYVRREIADLMDLSYGELEARLTQGKTTNNSVDPPVKSKPSISPMPPSVAPHPFTNSLPGAEGTGSGSNDREDSRSRAPSPGPVIEGTLEGPAARRYIEDKYKNGPESSNPTSASNEKAYPEFDQSQHKATDDDYPEFDQSQHKATDDDYPEFDQSQHKATDDDYPEASVVDTQPRDSSERSGGHLRPGDKGYIEANYSWPTETAPASGSVARPPASGSVARPPDDVSVWLKPAEASSSSDPFPTTPEGHSGWDKDHPEWDNYNDIDTDLYPDYDNPPHDPRDERPGYPADSFTRLAPNPVADSIDAMGANSDDLTQGMPGYRPGTDYTQVFPGRAPKPSEALTKEMPAVTGGITAPDVRKNPEGSKAAFTKIGGGSDGEDVDYNLIPPRENRENQKKLPRVARLIGGLLSRRRQPEQSAAVSEEEPKKAETGMSRRERVGRRIGAAAANGVNRVRRAAQAADQFNSRVYDKVSPRSPLDSRRNPINKG